MEKNEILNIFYNNIVNEASTGRVECYSFHNVLFSCKYGDKFIQSNNKYNNVIVPVLNISNKEEFDNLLFLYVDKARKFYDKGIIDEGNTTDKDKNICIEKTIMTLLWSNASIDDFNNPCEYLRKRISFLYDERLSEYGEWSNIGKSTAILDSDIFVKLDKNKIYGETPYSFSISIVNGKDTYALPRIYFGLYNNDVFVYAIQNDKGVSNNSDFSKKINRLLFKLDSGFNTKEDNYENYDSGNLKDITKSFLLASNIFLGIVKNYGIDTVIVPSFLIERWNAKEIFYDYMMNNEYGKHKDKTVEEAVKIRQDDLKEHESIQSNLTEKLIRTFMRFEYHHKGISVDSYPMDKSDCLHLSIDNYDECNNFILDETYNLINGDKRDLSK